MLTKLETDIALALYRRMPTKEFHIARGWVHGPSCYPTCHHTWEGDVNVIAQVLGNNNKDFNPVEFMALVENGDEQMLST